MTTSGVPRAGSILQRSDLHDLPEYAEPVDNVERALCSLWEGSLGIDSVGVDDDYFALGGTSVQALTIFEQLTRRFGAPLPVSSLYMNTTVRLLGMELKNLLNVAQSGASHAISSWTPIMLADGPEPSLFLVPGLECEPVGFEQVVRSLSGSRRVYGLQLPGIYDGKAPCYDLQEMAAGFAAAIAECGSDQAPVTLMGQCAGGILALEIARQLQVRDLAAAAVWMLDPPWLYGRPDIVSGSAAGIMQRQSRRLRRALRSLMRQPLRHYIGYYRRRERLNPFEISRRRVRFAYTQAVRNHMPAPNNVEVGLIGLAQRGDCRIDKWRTFLGNHIRPVMLPGRDTGDALRGDNVACLIEALRLQVCETSL